MAPRSVRQSDPKSLGEGIGRSCPESNGKAAIEQLKLRLKEDRVTRLALMILDKYEDVHLKDQVVDSMDDARHFRLCGKTVINFGSDSLLGFDRDPRIQKAIVESLEDWGTHNGASRAFTSVALCEEAERRLAQWLNVDETLIFPSVTLANAGLLPALAGKGDLLVVDRLSHDTLWQAAKVAAHNGANVRELNPATPNALVKILEREDYEGCIVAVDGVYSMTGTIPPLDALDQVTRSFGGILYIDDAHGTAVIGPRGRGAAAWKLDSLENVLMVGSLSKAFSCLGAFVTCDQPLKRMLKIRSSTFIFGGPVPPPYLAAICAVCDLIESPEYDEILGRLQNRVKRLVDGIRRIGLPMTGGLAAVVAITIGDIEKTLSAGKWLFDRGFYVQSATYPAVPLMGGILRIQVNANHSIEAIDCLLDALDDLKTEFELPGN
ncbi:MAG: aminotransferase class I/II-fold pyridoxal phosphate-dependent enzyme [Pirellulales bacterium]|nr:aminotransferase class I/II-fold pyridoxal phosphate-dependent enzyme [Pirellulales bacterium]